jgi:hypothetical protein
MGLKTKGNLMESVVTRRLRSVKLGDHQVYKNIVVLPVLPPDQGTFDYLTLVDALGGQSFAITEVSSAGSVPELLWSTEGKSRSS